MRDLKLLLIPKEVLLKKILEDMRTAEQDVGKAAREIKQTLVTGGGIYKELGANLVLEHILENKLQFTKGQSLKFKKALILMMDD